MTLLKNMLCTTSKRYVYYYLITGVRYSVSSISRRSKSFSSLASDAKSGKIATDEASTSQRLNPLGIQMISESLHSQLFGPTKPSDENSKESRDKIQRSVNHLKHHNLLNKRPELLPEVDFEIPKFKGKNLDEHFRIIANEQTEKYRQLLNNLVENKLPRPPNKWNFQVGWTKYMSTGEMMTIDFPEDEALIFDVEVCVVEGRLPTLATAVSPNCWYSWCSPRLTDENFRGSQLTSTNDLISLETKHNEVNPPDGDWKERIIVGHHINYDRALIKEQYYLKRPKTRFLDTLSMHIAIAGMSRSQRSMAYAEEMNGMQKDEKSHFAWSNVTSKNNLRDVHQLYCGGIGLNKDQRKMFVVAPMQDIKANFQQLMTYCSKDVVATHEVLQAMLPVFLQRFPHPVTLAGMLEMNEFYLPVNENWSRYMTTANSAYKKFEDEMKTTLDLLAKEATQLLEGNKHQVDPWLWDLDWRCKKSSRRLENYTKFLPNKSKIKTSLDDTENNHPKWYRLFSGEEEPQSSQQSKSQRKPQISYKSLVIPKLLRLSWLGYPLHYSTAHGWGYLVPKNRLKLQDRDDSSKHISIDTLWENVMKKLIRPQELSNENKISEETAIHTFYPIPQTYDITQVENPISGLFLTKLEDGTIQTNRNDKSKRILELLKINLNWRSARKLIADELVVWLQQNELTQTVIRDSEYLKNKLCGIILPRIVLFGMPNRCATEQLWLSQGNTTNRLGSELLGMIQTPPGYNFVGSSIDSQDLWISAMIGDSKFAAIHGCTAFSWLLIQGRNCNQTDIHSYVANSLGISRDSAKVINYARIYGLDESFTQDILQQFNRGLATEEVDIKIKDLFAQTKGVKGYRLNETGIELYKVWKNDKNLTISDACLTKCEILQMLENQNSLQFDDVVSKSVWIGGSESAFFNRLESIIKSTESCTPFLESRISRSLDPSVVDDDFLTDRINWLVQSSSIDYLHLMVVCMRWLCEEYKIDARFSFSIYNEIRYLVKTQDKYRAALALQIANLLTRATFSSKLGINDLPQFTAFLSSVSIDRVLRKDVSNDYKTPSNPNGLTKTYDIPEGEAVNIYQILDKTNGSLEP